MLVVACSCNGRFLMIFCKVSLVSHHVTLNSRENVIDGLIGPIIVEPLFLTNYIIIIIIYLPLPHIYTH